VEQRSLNAYVAELLGTFVLVFSITLVVTLFVNAQGTGSDWAVVGLVHAFVLFMLIAGLGAVSGGHFNPAVTIGATVLRKLSPTDGAMYVVMQLIGGILGAWMTKFVLDDALADQVNVGAGSLNKALLGGTAEGLVVEALGTFFLVWAVVALALNPKAPKEWAPLVIGATLGFAVMIGGALTGGVYNPARWFGPALIGSEFGDWWAYLVGDIGGGILGAVAYWYLFVGGGETSSRPGAPT
jgi:MIP family channel proteins